MKTKDTIKNFLKVVKMMNETMPVTSTDKIAKTFVAHAMKTCRKECTPTQVMKYLQTLVDENKPGYANHVLDNNDWKKIVLFNSEMDDDFGKTLRTMLSALGNSKKIDYLDLFEKAATNCVKDFNFIKTECTIDYLGWKQLVRYLTSVLSVVDVEEVTVPEEEIPAVEDKQEMAEPAPVMKVKQHRPKKIHIYQYSLSGEKIAEYASLTEAAAKTGVKHCSISKNLNGSYKSAGGFIWSKVELSNIKNAA